MAKSYNELEEKDILVLILRFLVKKEFSKTAKKLIKESKLDLEEPVK